MSSEIEEIEASYYPKGLPNVTKKLRYFNAIIQVLVSVPDIHSTLHSFIYLFLQKTQFFIKSRKSNLNTN